MLKRFLVYLKSGRIYLIISCLCVTVETLLEMFIPVLMADLIDIGVVMQNKEYIFMKGFQMIVCAAIALLLGQLYARTAAIAGQEFGAELRSAQYRQFQSFSFKNIDRFSTSSLVTRLTGDINILQNSLTTGIRPVIRAPMLLFVTLIMTFRMNWQLSLVFFIAAPVLGTVLYLILRQVRSMFGGLQKAFDLVNLIVQENLTAIRLIKSYVREGYEEEKFHEVNTNLQSVSEKAFRLTALNVPCFQAVMYTTILAILWFGGNLVFIGSMKVGQLTGFLSYVLQILNSLMMISNIFMMLTRSAASGTRILEVFDEIPDIDENQNGIHEIKQGSIAFDHVYFKYKETAGEYVLSDISFQIESGQTIGIIGGTGSAKTSLVQLIPRLYDATKGTVKIDGISVKEYAAKPLRNAIGVVLQKNTLFSGTIRDNLLWGNPEATDEELQWACHIACADEFIQHMINGLNTSLGQGGVNLSGGQKQRLCIARAILKHPRILILDDSTSAVDTATESTIRTRLDDQLPDTTKIIIAQRISSIMHANNIIILKDGEIHAMGNHETLQKDCLMYREIYDSQQEGADL